MKKENSFFEGIKNKIFESISSQIKDSVKNYQKFVMKNIEKQIERKIKKAAKAVINKIIFFSLLGIGFLFLTYGIIAMIVHLLTLPEFLTPLIFGLLTIIIGTIIYLLN